MKLNRNKEQIIQDYFSFLHIFISLQILLKILVEFFQIQCKIATLIVKICDYFFIYFQSLLHLFEKSLI